MSKESGGSASFPNSRETPNSSNGKLSDATGIKKGTCPLCHEEKKLIWHHWDYEENIGCWLCQSCHTAIHNGLGLSDFPWSNVLQRLTYRYIKMNYPDYYEKIERGNIAEFSRRIRKTFNIPFDESFVYSKVYKVVKQFPKDTSSFVFKGPASEEELKRILKKRNHKKN